MLSVTQDCFQFFIPVPVPMLVTPTHHTLPTRLVSSFLWWLPSHFRFCQVDLQQTLQSSNGTVCPSAHMVQPLGDCPTLQIP